MAGAPNAVMCLVKCRGQWSSIHPLTHQGDRTWSLNGSWQKSMLHCIYTPQGSAAAINSFRVLYVYLNWFYLQAFLPIDLCHSRCFTMKFVCLSSSLHSCYCSSCFISWTSQTHPTARLKDEGVCWLCPRKEPKVILGAQKEHEKDSV